MDIAYFDSSALVKLVVVEDGSEQAAALRGEADEVVSSELAYVEVRAALAAAQRDRRLTAQQHRSARVRWERIWDTTSAVTPATALIAHAGDLAEEYALRGYDAVHLASALALESSSIVVVSWDGRMRAGADRAGLAIAPATT